MFACMQRKKPLRSNHVCLHVRFLQPSNQSEPNLEGWFPSINDPAVLTLSQNTLSPSSLKYHWFCRFSAQKFDFCLHLCFAHQALSKCIITTSPWCLPTFVWDYSFFGFARINAFLMAILPIFSLATLIQGDGWGSMEWMSDAFSCHPTATHYFGISIQKHSV